MRTHQLRLCASVVGIAPMALLFAACTSEREATKATHQSDSVACDLDCKLAQDFNDTLATSGFDEYSDPCDPATDPTCQCGDVVPCDVCPPTRVCVRRVDLWTNASIWTNTSFDPTAGAHTYLSGPGYDSTTRRSTTDHQWDAKYWCGVPDGNAFPADNDVTFMDASRLLQVTPDEWFRLFRDGYDRYTDIERPYELVTSASGWLEGCHLGETDTPSSHSYGGFDLSCNIALDRRFQPFLADGNWNNPDDTEMNGDVANIRDFLHVPNGVGALHIEQPRFTVPRQYFSGWKPRMRSAVFGEAIVDCGHKPFATELHPVLLNAFTDSSTGHASHASFLGRASFWTTNEVDWQGERNFSGRLIDEVKALNTHFNISGLVRSWGGGSVTPDPAHPGELMRWGEGTDPVYGLKHHPKMVAYIQPTYRRTRDDQKLKLYPCIRKRTGVKVAFDVPHADASYVRVTVEIDPSIFGDAVANASLWAKEVVETNTWRMRTGSFQYFDILPLPSDGIERTILNWIGGGIDGVTQGMDSYLWLPQGYRQVGRFEQKLGDYRDSPLVTYSDDGDATRHNPEMDLPYEPSVDQACPFDADGNPLIFDMSAAGASYVLDFTQFADAIHPMDDDNGMENMLYGTSYVMWDPQDTTLSPPRPDPLCIEPPSGCRTDVWCGAPYSLGPNRCNHTETCNPTGHWCFEPAAGRVMPDAPPPRYCAPKGTPCDE